MEDPNVTPDAPPPMVGADGVLSDNFSEQLGDEFKDDVPTLSRYNGKHLKDLAKSLMDGKRKLRADPESMITIPGEDDKEGWDKVHKRLGKPETPDDYTYDPNPEHTEVLGDLDKERLDSFKKFAHEELDMTPGKFKKALDWYLGDQAESIRKFDLVQQDKQKQDREQNEKLLKQEYGAAYDEQKALNFVLLEKYGGPEIVEKHGLREQFPPDLFKLIANVSKDMSEDRLRVIRKGSAPTPEQVEMKIMELRGSKAYTDRNDSGHQAALKEMENLYKKKHGEKG